MCPLKARHGLKELNTYSLTFIDNLELKDSEQNLRQMKLQQGDIWNYSKTIFDRKIFVPIAKLFLI